MQLAAGIHKEEVSVSQQLVVAPVVDGECIRPRCHDRRILRTDRHTSESRDDSGFCRSKGN